MSGEELRDRYRKSHGVTWKVLINQKLICDGFENRDQAHSFIDKEIKPLMEKPESIKKIEKMNEYNLISCVVVDYDGRQWIRIARGIPNKNLPDFDGM